MRNVDNLGSHLRKPTIKGILTYKNSQKGGREIQEDVIIWKPKKERKEYHGTKCAFVTWTVIVNCGKCTVGGEVRVKRLAFIEKGVGGEKAHICVLRKRRQHTNAKRRELFSVQRF